MTERLSVCSMRVAALERPHHFRIEERALPPLEPGWALVKVYAAGICGSDVHFFTGQLAQLSQPVRGHEIAGVVADPGDTGLSVGQAVVVHPMIGCGCCPACMRGERQLCPEVQFIGSTYPGGFAEYVAVPARNLLPFNADLLSFEQAALADCVAVAVHAVNKTRVLPGESVVVIGDGTIGLLLLQVAILRHANPVVIIGKHETNLAIGRQLGASLAVSGVAEHPLSIVQDAEGQADVVLEAVGGASPPLDLGMRLLRKGGRLAMLGLTAATEIEAPWRDLVRHELLLAGVMGYGSFEGQDEFSHSIGLMQSHQVLLEPLITHRVPLAEIHEGFYMMLRRQTSHAIKAVVLPQRHS